MRLRTLDEAVALRHQQPRAGRYPSRSPELSALIAIVDRICSNARMPEPWRTERLTHPEQVVLALGFELDAEVQNGGLHQYLVNSSGDHAELVRQYLVDVGAQGVAALMERVAAVFPGGVIPVERTERVKLLVALEKKEEKALWGLFDEATDEYHLLEQDLYTRLMDYVEAHRQDFALPKLP